MRPWHCYYHFMLGFLLLHCIFAISTIILSKELYFDLLAFIATETVLIVGLYGFVKKRPIYKQWLWRIASVVGLLVLCYLLYDMRIPFFMDDYAISLLPSLLIFLLLSPWLYGLIRYGFLSHDIWVKNT